MLFPGAAEGQEGWASGDEVSLEDEKGVCAARRSPLRHLWRPAAKKEEWPACLMLQRARGDEDDKEFGDSVTGRSLVTLTKASQ